MSGIVACDCCMNGETRRVFMQRTAIELLAFFHIWKWPGNLAI